MQTELYIRVNRELYQDIEAAKTLGMSEDSLDENNGQIEEKVEHLIF